VQNRDRRAGHPLHPREVIARGRVAADHHAWLARLDHRDARGHRSAARAAGQPRPEVKPPVGFTTFPGEIWRTPRSWVEKSYPNVTYFNEVDRGGHFAAWEEPELFATEIRAAFKPLR
jgi:pimeloyl-ACP methyl ester carboxylesterase